MPSDNQSNSQDGDDVKVFVAWPHSKVMWAVLDVIPGHWQDDPLTLYGTEDEARRHCGAGAGGGGAGEVPIAVTVTVMDSE